MATVSLVPGSSAPPSSGLRSRLPLRSHVPGSVRASVETLGGRRVIQARSVSGHHRGALTQADGDTIAEAARVALDERVPLVMVLSSVAGALVGALVPIFHRDLVAMQLALQGVAVFVSIFTISAIPAALVAIYRDLTLRREGSDLAARLGALAPR